MENLVIHNPSYSPIKIMPKDYQSHQRLAPIDSKRANSVN